MQAGTVVRGVQMYAEGLRDELRKKQAGKEGIVDAGLLMSAASVADDAEEILKQVNAQLGTLGWK